MEIKAVVEGKIITSQGVFARIKIKGLPKGSYHFFDIPDDGELCIGDKIELSIIRKADVTAPVVAIVPASLGQPIIFQPRATPSNSIDILLPEGPNYYAPEDAGSDAPGVDVAPPKPRSERIIPPHELTGYDGNTNYPGHIG